MRYAMQQVRREYSLPPAPPKTGGLSPNADRLYLVLANLTYGELLLSRVSLHRLRAGFKHPSKAIRFVLAYVDNRFQITENAKASGRGERIVIKDWQTAKNSLELSTLAHIQRYEWVLPQIRGRCLDAGCGSGYGTDFLAKRSEAESLIGIDLSLEAIAYATGHFRNEKLIYLQADVCRMVFQDTCFDSIVSFDVFEHLNRESQVMFLSEVVRILRKGGRLYVGCPNGALSLGRNPWHLREVDRPEFESLLTRHFRTVRILGQDLFRNGKRLGRLWSNHASTSTYRDLTIVETDCDSAFGLLAICENT